MNTTQEISIPKLNRDVVCLIKGMAHLKGEKETNLTYAATVQLNLMECGYILDDKAFNKLKTSSRGRIIEFRDNIIEYFEPEVLSYRDFPSSKMSDEDAKRFSEDLPRQLASNKYIVAVSAEDKDFLNILTTILESKEPMSQEDKAIVKWFVDSNTELHLPQTVPCKENLCELALMEVPHLAFDDSEDILRVAVYMSGGDISLKTKTVFKKFTRKERRLIMELLDRPTYGLRDMVLHDLQWVRLGEVIHPGDYKDRYPRAYQAFMVMRRGMPGVRTAKLKSWYGILQLEFKKSLDHGLNELLKRPVEFLKRMDWLIRDNQENYVHIASIIQRFKIAAAGAPNKELYKLYEHFKNRPSHLSPIDSGVIELVLDTILNSIGHKFKKLDSLGKTWIDPKLEQVPLPNTTLNASQLLKLHAEARGELVDVEAEAETVFKFEDFDNNNINVNKYMGI